MIEGVAIVEQVVEDRVAWSGPANDEQGVVKAHGCVERPHNIKAGPDGEIGRRSGLKIGLSRQQIFL